MARPLGEFALIALLGLALLLNPVYLYPDGGGDVRHYEAVEIGEHNAFYVLNANDRALECTRWQRRSCKLEADVLAAGTLSYDIGVLRGGTAAGTSTWSHDDRPYDAVRIGGRNWYVPEADVRNGTANLSLRQVSEQGAVRAVARDVSSVPPDVRRVVERGSLDVHREIDSVDSRRGHGMGTVVEDDGTLYLVTYRGSSHHWTDDIVGVRIALIAVGAGLVLGAGYRLHRRTIEYWPK